MRNPSSRFSVAPLASKGNLSRSIFDRNHDFKFTLSAGKLYPIYVDEYLPGDTFKLDTSFVCRMSTPIHPVMDNCFMDIYYFAVPYRLTWDHWKEFMGESPEDPYINPVTYTIPQLKPDPDLEYPTVPAKSLMDYMGIPAGTTPRSFSALPFRAFSIVWNEYFRDQNLQNAIDVDTSDADGYYMNDFNIERDDYVMSTALGGALPPVNKYHDYFTSALLEPQKGEAVPIPLPAMSPVYASDEVSIENFNGFYGSPLIFKDAYNGSYYPDISPSGYLQVNSDGKVFSDGMEPETGNEQPVTPVNLFSATRDGDAFSKKFGYLGATINDLRYAFQIQKLLEADNRYGTRYTEIIKGHFGVNAPNGLLQRPEFLGGKRVRININQVLQTSATNEVSPQGNTAAYSVTSDRDASFTKSFTEHGVIIGVACIRNENTYQQGIEKFWLRSDRYDFYFPELANISEQPIQIQELYNPVTGPGYEGDNFEPTRTFGYQEAWADYRYKPSRVSGEFRSTYSQSLDVWHYADYYETEPVLSDEWIRADRTNIDRTLAVSSDVADQFIADFYFKVQATRPMPMYSIPGLSDHH